MIGIYKITNKVNGKVYIGQSRNIENRWLQHLKAVDDFPIHRAIRKYGFENFDFETIALCGRDELNRLEQFYVQEYDCIVPKGYNCNSGGNQNKEMSDETKRKISEAHKGKHLGPHSEEHRKKLSEALKGRHISEETRRKLSESHKGKPSPKKGKNTGPKTKCKWLTPSGDIVEMGKGQVHRFHSDWTEIKKEI